MIRAGALALAAAALAVAAHARPAAPQDLAARVRSAPAGDVVFRFAARTGVCGDGDVLVRQRPGGGTSISFIGDLSTRDGRDFDNLDTWCRPGPVQVRLNRRGAEVNGIRLTVGAALDGAHELGEVAPDEAVAWLVSDLARNAPDRVASRALHAASLAAAEAWRPILALARDPASGAKLRKSAMHWLAVDASDRLLAGQPHLDDAAELRRQAVFALSRRSDEQSRAALRELARPGTDSAVRAAAVYWIGLSDLPDALPVLEAVLRGG